MPIWHGSASRSPRRRSHSRGRRDDRRSDSRGGRRRSRDRRSNDRRSRTPEKKEPLGPRGAKTGSDQTRSFSGGVVIGNPEETEPPTYDVEQVGRKHNGDPTFQAILNIKGQGGRIRSLRAPPRANEDDARDDGEEMKDCFMKHGMQGLRELQQKQRRSRIS
ncbi:unnamed protein product [Durusdinium trenchii]|uniref:Uncharacterized protein n=2 Tax=Durusdinium trenchii TaxID=1381693 RepID=A0ABP0J6T5_9DINO